MRQRPTIPRRNGRGYSDTQLVFARFTVYLLSSPWTRFVGAGYRAPAARGRWRRLKLSNKNGVAAAREAGFRLYVCTGMLLVPNDYCLHCLLPTRRDASADLSVTHAYSRRKWLHGAAALQRYIAHSRRIKYSAGLSVRALRGALHAAAAEAFRLRHMCSIGTAPPCDACSSLFL